MIAVADAPCPGGLPEGFLELPPAVYRDDPAWIPEDPREVAGMFSPRNPWFAKNRAHAFSVPGRARAAAFFDPALQPEGRPAAFFGYWESAGDAAANAALFAAVERWARDQGAEELYGPVNFGTAFDYRLLLSAEPGALPFLGEPYNPLRYPAELAALGYAIHRRYQSQHWPAGGDDWARRDEARRIHDRVLAAGYRIEPVTPVRWQERLPELHRLLDDTFRENFAYVPFPYPIFADAFGAKLVKKVCQPSSCMAFTPEGEIAGVCLFYPHYGPLVVQGAGASRVPVGELDFARDMPRLETHGRPARICKTLGVGPRHRKIGVGGALLVAGLSLDIGRYSTMIAALMREDNPSRRYGTDVVAERWYGLYRKPL